MYQARVFHPILFAIFPILFLYAHNANQISIVEIFMPIGISIVSALLLWGLFNLFLKDAKKSALSASLFLILFFSFGHIYEDIRYLHIGLVKIGRGGYLLVLFGLLLVLETILAKRSKMDLTKLTSFLNTVSISLVVFSLMISGYKISTRQDIHSEAEVSSAEIQKPTSLPDIYYIVLDAYARSDVLTELYNYDNSYFLEFLDQKGFYVASRSTSNYSYTAVSLASSLNMTYLDDLVKPVDEEYKNPFLLKKMIKYNKVSQFLRKHGYTFATFSTGYSLTEMDNADVFVSKSGLLSEFQTVLLNTTPIPKILEAVGYHDDLHRERVLFIFDSLPTIQIASPKFVVAHITCPNTPFVFGQDGEPIESQRRFAVGGVYKSMNESLRQQYRQRYREQLAYITKKVMEAIESIMATSVEPPIIVLQSDHGPASLRGSSSLDEITSTSVWERMSILNAFYLPQVGHQELYDSITPVNTFRMIFNSYFGTNYELVKDENYWSNVHFSFKFFNVTDKMNTFSYEQTN